MIEFFLLCATYAWDPPRHGSVDHYEIYVDGKLYPETTTATDHEICLYDDREHYVQVIAIGKHGQRSDISDKSDLYRYPPTEYREPVSNVLRADFDGSGVVDAGDFAVFYSLFGARHCFGRECE